VAHTLKTENLKLNYRFPELGTLEHLNRQSNAEIPRLGKKKQPKNLQSPKIAKIEVSKQMLGDMNSRETL
jgi:hypothetical protein